MNNNKERHVVGSCMQMCPEDEIFIRQQEKLLHRLEMVESTVNTKKPIADRKRIVKAFCRSGVGQDTQTAETLRPPPVLLETVDYLLGTVINNTKYPWQITYDFLMDRLRSVRQDMVIQSLPKAPTISILQPIVRFHAFAAYKLCDQDISNFDPVINNKHLQECILKVLVSYDECELFKSRCEGQNLSLVNYDDIYSYSRPMIESLYILHNLGNNVAIYRGLMLPEKWRTWEVKISLKLSISFLRNDWVQSCKLMKKLPTLLAAVASLHLPELRRRAFQVMSSAYNSKQLWYPIKSIKDLLLYGEVSDLLSDLKHYNIKCDKDNQNVQFIKGTFKVSSKTVKARHEEYVENALHKINLTDLILYGIV